MRSAALENMGAKRRGWPVAVLLLVFVAQLVHVARVYSVNWDEAHHLYDGYSIWTRHDYRLNAEVPPLVKLLAALPLLPMHLTVPPGQGKSQALEAFVDGRAFVFGNGGDRVLFPARMACMVLVLLLAVLLYVSAAEMFGGWSGLAALALFVLDPLVLAHGTLVSTDVGSACFLLATVYAFYRYVKAPSAGRLLLTGVAFGLAMCAKFTGIFGLPILVLLAVAEAVLARDAAVLWRRLAACFAVLVCAWVIVWAFYGFRYAPAPAGRELSPQLEQYLASMPSKANAAELGVLAKARLLPEAYIWGLANTKKTEWEYTSYFFGRMYRHGPALYFPAAFLIKSTLPMLLCLVLLPWVWFRRGERHARELCFVLVPVVFYFALVTTSHMDIGARHLMPVYPFLYALAGVAVAHGFTRRGAWAVVAAVLLAWQVVTSWRVAPAYMAYGNEAWGGPAAVHRYLSDANVDWGQQLKAVRQYLEMNNVRDCWFAYFPDGAVEPEDYGVHCRRLPTGSSLWWFGLPMEVPPVIEGTVLISDSDLVDVRKTGELVAAGQPAAALAMARTAAELAPNSAIAQMNLADRLAAAALWGEAAEAYRRGGELARTVRPELQGEDLVPRSEAGLRLGAEHLPAR